MSPRLIALLLVSKGSTSEALELDTGVSTGFVLDSAGFALETGGSY